MSALLVILLSSVLVNVLAPTSVSALRPFVGHADLFDSARAMAIASAITIPFVALFAWPLDALLRHLQVDYLRTPAFVGLVLTAVPLVEAGLRKQGRYVPQRPGFMLLMTTNASVLGAALLATERMESFATTLLFAIAAGLAFAVLLVSFAAMYERLRYADVPKPFRDAPLALVTAGIMALAAMGFVGLIQE